MPVVTAKKERNRIIQFLRDQSALVLHGGSSGQLDLVKAEFAAAVMEEIARSLEEEDH